MMYSGTSEVQAVEVAAPTGCGSCLQDDGTKTLTWKFVGHGQGTFEPVQSYNYVGQGRGSFEKEVIVTPGQWNMQKVVMCLSVPLGLLVLGLGFLLINLLRASGPFWTNTSFDCNQGLDNWAASWDKSKKDYCCRNEQKGCMPQIKGCQTECNYQRRTATCASRIQWGATNQFVHHPNACAEAYKEVVSECPFCSSCDLAQAYCHPAPLR